MKTCRIFTDLIWISKNYDLYLKVEDVADYTRNSIEKIKKETSLGNLNCIKNDYNAFDVVYWNHGIDKMVGDRLILISYKHTGLNNLKEKKSKEPRYGKITKRNNGLLMCSLSCPGKKRENLYARDKSELIAKADAWVLEEKQKILFERLKTETDGNIEELSRRIENEIKSEDTVNEAKKNKLEVANVEPVVVNVVEDVPTFEMAYRKWINNQIKRKVKAQTVDRYEAGFKRHILSDKEFINKPVNKITTNDVYDILCKIKSANITKKEFNGPKQVINDTLEYIGCIDEIDISLKVDFEKVEKKLKHLNDAEFAEKKRDDRAIDPKKEAKFKAEIDKQAKASCTRKARYYLIKLNFYLGLRAGELAALTVDDIDLVNGTVTINKAEISYRDKDKQGKYTGKKIYEIARPKTAKGIRVIPLVEQAREIVEELLAYRKRHGYRNKELIYDGETKKLVDRTGKLYSVYKKVALACDTSTNEFRSHLQRKTLATNLINSGADYTDIQDILGHKQFSTTLENYVVPETKGRKTSKLMASLQQMVDKRECMTYEESRIS